ncbi:MAG: hypothetical protein AAB637_00980 [Patescibacteria group bacterium]
MPPTYQERKPLEHKEILYSVIAVSMIIWAIFYVQVTWTEPEQKMAVSSENTGLTEAEKENAASIMNQKLKDIPPLTEKQKEDIAKQMMKKLTK